MPKSPTLLQSLLPLLALIGLIGLNVALLEDDTLSGANQLSLLIASALAVGIATYNRVPWSRILQEILHTLGNSLSSILILMMIGVLAGAWMVGGIIPAMVYYGLYILQPAYFLPAAVVIAAVISVATGSSWSTVATVGVALLGIGQALGFPPPLIAGAIISGAYFGDKISPLSDTTNLASAVARVELFTHIRYMLYTTVPTMFITLVLFTVISLCGSGGDPAPGSVAELQGHISSYFRITPWLFLVPAAVLVMIARKMPALPALFIGALLGVVAALVFQGDVIASLGGGEHSRAAETYRVLSRALYGSTQIQTGVASLDNLFSSHGMAGMMNTIWLIVTAMVFGGVMEAGGFLERITSLLIRRVRSDGSLVATTAASCVLFNATASDQYIAIVVPGRMFARAYRRRGLAPEVLSRTLEDAGTATSVLIPWNTCGATQAGVLGVATFAYLPYAFFCYLSPLMSILFASLNIRIRRIAPGEEDIPDNSLSLPPEP